jgi:hypothetical protein
MGRPADTADLPADETVFLREHLHPHTVVAELPRIALEGARSMRTRNRIAFTLAAALSVAFSAQQATAGSGPTEARSSFSIVVNATGPGITATCEHGCAWKEVSATFPGGRYRITEQGIHPVRGETQPAPGHARTSGFSMVLTRSGEGISAACVEGCAWSAVSATYPASTYQITEHGIAPVR